MTNPKLKRYASGFTLLELIVAMAITILVLGMGAQLYKQATLASDLLMARAEMQQNARAAINAISREISIAGTGIPKWGCSTA